MRIHAIRTITLGHHFMLHETQGKRLVIAHEDAGKTIACLDIGPATKSRIETLVNCLNQMKGSLDL